ncbi:MAG: CdaR family protein [Solibacillus sp.]
MDKLFDSPWVLRIAALFLSGLLFLYVQYSTNETGENSTSTEADLITNVPLEVYYDDTNLHVTGLPKTVDVKISGPMQIVLKTKLSDDYKVFVDLNALLIGEHRVTIQHENFSDKLDVMIDPGTITVVIEERIAEEFRVDPEMNSRLISEDYTIKGMTAEPSRVSISGAKSVVESISYVKATVTGEKGISETFNQEATVKVLDRDLNKLDVMINPEKVNVHVEVNEYSKELPITIKTKGTPKEGVAIENLSADPHTAHVYGSKTVIDALTEIVAEFDVAVVDDAGSYDAQLVLPTGATKLSQEKIIIHADVSIAEQSAVETGTEVEAEAKADTSAQPTTNEQTE